MSDDLIKLEIQREQLYQRMQSIGDFRRGSISVTFCPPSGKQKVAKVKQKAEAQKPEKPSWE